MKRTLAAMMVFCCGAGCAHIPEPLAVSPVGPTNTVTGQTVDGSLVVYSAWRRTGTDNPEHQIHSNYDVLSREGAPILHVHNYITPVLDDPATVHLAPGKYIVRARVQGYGTIAVPVIIEMGKLTALYMDDTTQPEEKQGELAVKLPDGRVIGWIANRAD